MDSMTRFTFVLPVPVTEFNQIVPNDIINKANETVRKTGVASLINSFPKAVTNNDSLTLNINVRRNGTGLRNAEVILQTNVKGIDSIFTIPIQVQVESNCF